MIVVCNNWAQALRVLNDVQLDPPADMYIIAEGALPGKPREGFVHPTWSQGTGRYKVTDHRTGERVAKSRYLWERGLAPVPGTR